MTYADQVERIGRLGGFAAGSYTCKCIGCGEQFMGDKRSLNCLPCVVSGLHGLSKQLHAVLSQHHEFHCQDGLEMKLGDEYFDCALAYVDSTLEEETTNVLGQWPIHHVPPTVRDSKEVETCPHHQPT